MFSLTWNERDGGPPDHSGVGATILFGKDGGNPWHTLSVQDLLDERWSDGAYKHDWMYVAPQ